MKTLTETREEVGLSRRKLATIIGMPAPQLRLYEIGRYTPTLENAERIAAALGVEPEDIAEFQPRVERNKAEAEARDRYTNYLRRGAHERSKVCK